MFESVPGVGFVIFDISLLWGFFISLISFISLGGFLVGTLSALSPLPWARNTTLFYYTPPDYFPSIKCIFNNPNIDSNAMHPICRSVCQVCALFLCRIGEVLSLCLSDILEPDRVICTGSKRGSAYIMYLPGLSQQVLLSKVSDPSLHLFPVSYSQCYRSFIRAGIRLYRPGRKNSMRCHVGRYQVKQLFQEGKEISVLSDLLHHKSKTSVLYYL